MMKRALSLLLCLIMVLGLTAPSVQAAGDVYTSDNVMDNIVFDGDFSGNIVIDGNTVTSSGETKLPYPSDLLNQDTSVVEYVCECADLSSAVDHVGVCQIKLPYMKQCETTVQELFALWGSYTLVEQDFMLEYLEDTYPLKHHELVKLLNAPTGSASETLADGTIVSVQGIPQDGALTVGAANNEVKDIVEDYVAKQEESATELFGYDVSVQDGEGADWQPEVPVMMELELPGQKLHKNTKVYVVHVDDEGNASTIEAEVTEDGKIAFKTPGFSAFYGFTVDFDYEGALFSIPGGTSIKLSELFENLKMPLNAEDVINVEYTDYTQITVEQIEGDWLLTSLKEFDTEEKMTLTMSDGTVYNIKVTDEITTSRGSAYFTTREDLTTSIRDIDMRGNTAEGQNGVFTITVNKNGENDTMTAPTEVTNVASGYYHYVWQQPIVFDGHNANGAFEVAIQKPDGQTGTFYLSIYHWYIRRGAIVNIYLKNFTSSDTLIIQQNHDNLTTESKYNMEPMFNIEQGALYLNVKDSSLFPSSVTKFNTSSSGAKVILDHNNYTANAQDATIYMQCNSTNLYVSDTTFRDSTYRAIYIESNELTNFRLDNCTFEASVDYTGAVTKDDVVVGGGAAICVTEKILGAWVNVRNMTLNNCKFGAGAANGQGGAIAVWGFLDNTKLYKCTFDGCDPTQMGGAIALGQKKNIGVLTPNTQEIAHLGNITFEECTFKNLENGTSIAGAVLISQNVNTVLFKKCTFTDTKAQSFGGAIHIGGTDNTPVPFNSVKVENCTFTNCTAKGNYGGAMRICSNNVFTGKVEITGGTFTNCIANGTESTYTSGGAIAMDGVHYDDITISGATFTNCSSNRFGGAVFVGTTNNNAGTTRPTIGDVLVSGCNFNNITAASMGGVLAFDCDVIGSFTMTNSNVDVSSGTYGGAVFMGSSKDTDPITVGAVSISGCSFKNITGNNAGGTFFLSDGTYQSISVTNTSFENCISTRYSGALYLRTHTLGLPFVVNEDISIIGCSFKNCHAGHLTVSSDDIENGVPMTWDHDNDPHTPNIDKLNGVGGGGAITIGGKVYGKVEIKGASASNPTVFENCTTWNNGGAIAFATATTNAPTPEYGAVEFQYLNADKCFARDAGFFVYFAQVVIPELNVSDCVIQNCGYFDMSDPNFPRELVFVDNTYEMKQNNKYLDAKWFSFPTELNSQKDTYLARWQAYTQEDLSKSTDTGGTFRTIGNAFVIATIDNCQFLNNRSYSNGAGVYWNSLQKYNNQLPSLVIKNSIFDGNTSYHVGGALYCEATVTILSCEFMNNYATNRGGAIAQAVYNNSTRPLSDGEYNKIIMGTDPDAQEGEIKQPTKMHHNRSAYGGAVAIYVTVSDSINEGQNFPHYPIEFQLGGSHVYENVATVHGGGIYYATMKYDDDADQKEVDHIQKKINLDDGVIWGNISGASATPVTGNYTPQLGDHFVIAAVDSNAALSTFPKDNETYEEIDITQYTAGDLTFDDRTQIFTWHSTSTSNIYRLRFPNGKDLGVGGGSSTYKDELTFVSSTDAKGNWKIQIGSDGIASIISPTNEGSTTIRNWLGFNQSESSRWFDTYATGKAMSKVRIYRVLEVGNTRGTATLVTDINTLSDNDRVIIVANGHDYALGTGHSAAVFLGAPVNYSTNHYISYGADAQVITLGKGTVDSSYSLKVEDGKYLKTISDTGNKISVSTTLDASSSWKISINKATGEALITSQGTTNNNRNTIYYNTGDTSGDWFNNYIISSLFLDDTTLRSVAIYRVTSEENRTAVLVTDTANLRQTDKILIVAKDYGIALGAERSATTRHGVEITKLTTAMDFGPYTQVVTVVPGYTDGTYALQTPDGKYLKAALDRLTLTDTLNHDSSWTLSVTNGKFVAVSQSLNPYYIGYCADTDEFACYGNDVSQRDVMVYKLGIETGGGNGGGVYMNSNQTSTATGGYSELAISDSSIYGNTAYVGNGGGIYLTGVNALCEIKDNQNVASETIIGVKTVGVNQQGNRATGVKTGDNKYTGGNGGGIAIFGGARIVMEGGSVSNNSATVAGGGIAVHNSTMSFSDGYVQHNTALYGGGISVMNGGDVDTMSGNSPVWGMEFSNGTISDNVASTIGGGICLSSKSTMKLSGGKVLNNYAATETVSGNKISYSYAEGQWGGGIAVSQGSYMGIYSGRVDENHSHKGGGIGVNGHSEVQMKYSSGTTVGGSVSGNTAAENGGGIWLGAADSDALTNKITITGGTIDSNYAGAHGGGVHVDHHDDFILNDGTISNNVSDGYGGGICSQTENKGTTYSRIYLNGGTISDNTAASDGGGVYGYYYVNLTMSGTDLLNNVTTKASGGAVYLAYYGTVTITGGEIGGNKAPNGNGGGLVLWSYNASITGGDIHDNESKNGGGLYIRGYKSWTTMITGSPSIYGNKASGNGGGVFADAAYVDMQGGTIYSNTASGNGGGIYTTGNAPFVITTGTAQDENGNEITTRGEIYNNTANNGGGVYVTNGAQLEVHEGHITSNSAVATTMPNLTTANGYDSKLSGVGGGICVTAGTSDVKSSFTLTGTVNADGRMDVAIYGNSATFAADDVFASGNNTKLSVPKVEQMNLAGYDFRPEAWTEDYVTDDSQYSIGTKMLSDTEIHTLGISRYRNASPDARKEMLISASAIDSIVNQNNKYVCMTLGIPGATKDTVLVDYDTKVDIDVSRNDLFINDTSYNEGKSYIGESFPEGALHKDGISCSTGTKPLANTVKDKDGKNVLDSYSKTFDGKKGVVINNYNGVITFKANNTNIGTGYDFYYTVEREGFWYYAEVSVIPASSIYFDDSNSSIKYHKEGDSTLEHLATWSPVGSSMNATQAQIRPDTTLLGALDADKIYGYDSSFATTVDYSNGSAYHVTAERHYGVDNDGDSKCDALLENGKECGIVIELTHAFAGKGTKCSVCLNTKDKHGDVADHTCTDVNHNEYCDLCSKWIGTHTINARATFTFTGTGFDIVSLCNADTGIVMITVFKGVVEDWDDPNWNNYVASYMVDTYYGYDYDSGKWVPDQNSTTSLYQVPVIQTDLSKVMMIADDPATENEDETAYKDFGYGTYSVEIYVAPSFVEHEQGYWSTDFYLDGIRIYNPAGDGTGIYVTDEPMLDENGDIIFDEYYQPVYKEIHVDNTEIMDIYKEDGEGWPIYQELRNLIISHNHTLKDEAGSGIVFIDGNETPSLEDYIGYGPNNEVYLTAGKSIAFRLDALNYTNKLEEATHQDFDGSVVESIHLGIRGLTGQSAVTITDSNGNAISQALGTTDMYYDISDMANKVVTITNTGSQAIAISNIKITHLVNPYGVEGTGSGTWSGRDLVTINQSDAQIALDILTPDKLVDAVLKPKYPALSFEGMVSYNVFFSAEQLGGLTAADLGLAVFDSYDPEGTVETAKDVILGATQIDGLYMVATNGVHAKYLGDTQYFRAFVKKADGTYIYSKMVSYSALDYAKNVLAKSNDVKLKQLVVAMLNYGAEAQKFFGYDTENLMNKDLTADQQNLLTGYDASLLDAVVKADPAKVGAFGSTGGFAKKYPAISFKGAFEINYFMAPSNAVDSEMTLYCWSEDTYNSVMELTSENADKVVAMSLENGLYTASSFEIAAKELDKTVYVAAVYESNGQTYCSGVLPYSIAAYCQKPSADVAALANAAAVYGCTAKEYFGA